MLAGGSTSPRVGVGYVRASSATVSRGGFGASARGGGGWIEPIWKMLWSNKAILAVLCELFPRHPNLLETSRTPLSGDHARKPLLAREGTNVTVVRGGATLAESGGDYGGEGFVYQRPFDLPGSGDRRPVLGAWMVDGAPAGLGSREDGPITGNTARFVPHIIEG